MGIDPATLAVGGTALMNALGGMGAAAAPAAASSVPIAASILPGAGVTAAGLGSGALGTGLTAAELASMPALELATGMATAGGMPLAAAARPPIVPPISKPTPIESAANTALDVMKTSALMRQGQGRPPVTDVRMSPVQTGRQNVPLVSRPAATPSPVERYIAMLRRR